jgi:hypothetical protein
LINQIGIDPYQAHELGWSRELDESRSYLRGLVLSVLISGVMWVGIIAGISRLWMSLR